MTPLSDDELRIEHDDLVRQVEELEREHEALERRPFDKSSITSICDISRRRRPSCARTWIASGSAARRCRGPDLLRDDSHLRGRQAV
jgi:hypothetical protein